ncbi:MAG TPA: DNA polymerase I, partial [Candidatus Atribacteria bacterium]|nr:DNA polymerase I [Candidatus Atribacteria bacterium]
MKKFIIIDGQGLLYRTFYALPRLTTSYGQIINAVYGFTIILVKLIEEEKPDYIMVAFDTSKPTFRHKEFEDYKIHRKKMPDELMTQIPLVEEIIRNYNISICSKEGYEADDIIGTMVKKAEKRNYNTLIVTGDKDIFQLISPFTKVMTTIKGITEVKVYDEESIRDKYGVKPDKIVDIIALKGDSSDNIPGVPGIGEKTAINLIKKYGNINNLFDNIDKISKKSLREQLIKYKEQVLMSKKLATIITNVPIDYNLDDFKVKSPNYGKLLKIFNKLEFKNLAKKISPQINQENKKIKYNLVETKEKLNELINIIKKEKYFSFYLVTSSDNNVSSQILGIAISFKNNETFYIPFSPLNLMERLKYLSSDAVLRQLGLFFKDEKIIKIGHDLKPSFIVLNRYQVELKGNNFDTMIAAYLLNPSKEEYNLDSLFWEYLGYLKNKEKRNNE